MVLLAILGIIIALSAIILPFVVSSLHEKVKALETQLNQQQDLLQTLISPKEVPRQSVNVAQPPLEDESEKALPPPPPPKEVIREELSEPVLAPLLDEQFVTKEEPPIVPKPPLEPSPEPSQFLSKIGLVPPEKGSGLVMAWWSTRIGVMLAVIAAVFLGMHVNQSTTPLVRWLQMMGVSLGVFAGGWRLEKKIPKFGRVLCAGGLGLIYVCAYATYALPAMKITDSAWIGAFTQFAAIGLIAGWALYKRRESIFALALTLGYVTALFSLIEGIAPLPYISLVSLSIFGSAMFAWKGWSMGLLGSLIGTSIGLVFYTGSENILNPWLIVITCVALMAWTIICLGWKKKQNQEVFFFPIYWVSVVWLSVSLIIAHLTEIELKWIHLIFAVCSVSIGALWNHLFKDISLRNKYWAKAVVLFALFLIAILDGPSRSFALLVNATCLLLLA